jgi:hypothetical protein
MAKIGKSDVRVRAPGENVSQDFPCLTHGAGRCAGKGILGGQRSVGAGREEKQGS